MPPGRQHTSSFACAMSESSDKGPKPKDGVVDQKKAVTGAFIAEHKCKGPESFT